MAKVYDNWGRLVRATLRRDQLRLAGQSHERKSSAVPERTRNINAILQAADAIQAEDVHVAWILSEQAYSMAQKLDPNSKGTGVVQFKTGLMRVIKQKQSKEDGGRIDCNCDAAQYLWDFYQRYKRVHRVDEILIEEQNMGGLGQRSQETKKAFTILRALVVVMEALSNDAAPDGVGIYITEEIKRLKRTDPGLSGDLTPYNIPHEAPNAITEEGSETMANNFETQMSLYIAKMETEGALLQMELERTKSKLSTCRWVLVFILVVVWMGSFIPVK